jgi:hypothetical protein
MRVLRLVFTSILFLTVAAVPFGCGGGDEKTPPKDDKKPAATAPAAPAEKK